MLRALRADRAVAQGVVEIAAGAVYLGCAEGTIELIEVKPDGKRAMEAAAWAAGVRERTSSWEALS